MNTNLLKLILLLILFSGCNKKMQENSQNKLNLTIDTAVYYWEEGLCQYESYFDSTKISRQQLDNAYSLIIQNDFLNIGRFATYISDIEKLNIDTLTFNYKKNKNYIKNMLLPDITPFDSIRKVALNEIEMVYKGNLAVYKALINKDYDDALRLSPPNTDAKFYVESIIEGGDSLYNAWKKITEKIASNNGEPERVWEKFHKQYNSDYWDIYARLDIMNFGWWNTYNQTIPYLEIDQIQIFKNLFIKTEQQCYD